MPRLPATPSQTIGPFFSVGLDRPEWSDLAASAAEGQRIILEGTVLDGERAPVSDALIEIWQADAQGRYLAGFFGFGRAQTDPRGAYRFTTIKPGRVLGQAPHINLTVFARGLLRHLCTRVYFAGEASNGSDPVLSEIPDPEARKTLLAILRSGAWRFDIVLQGEGETVFFDV